MTQPLGNYMEIITARSTDPEIRSKSQDGGIVSAAFIYGIENGLLDGSIVASADNFNPKPIVATTKEQILEARGTKYSISPNVAVLKNAVREYGLENVGFVGTPCQLIALRKAIKYPLGFRHVGSKVGLIVGIFCMENFNYQSMKILIEEYADVSMDDVVKTDIGKGKLWVYKKGQEDDPITVPLKETHIFEQKSCHVCTDYTSELADFSTGSVGSPDGWSTVIIRTKRGKEFIDKMIADGKLETQPADLEGKGGIPLLEKLSNGKKEKSLDTIRIREENGLPVPKLL